MEALGSKLLLLELTRQVQRSSAEEASIGPIKVEAASMNDLEALLDDQASDIVSRWWVEMTELYTALLMPLLLCRSHNELRLWFPSLKSINQLKKIRHSTSRSSPASVLLESAQYYIAANHLPLLQQEAPLIYQIAESLFKTSLAEVMLSSTYTDDAVLALQLASFFQVSGTLSLPLMAASTRAARLVMLSTNSLTSRLAWCSASVWEACIALGLENGLELFQPEQNPTLAFLDILMNEIDREDIAVRAVLVRGRSLAHLSHAWLKMKGADRQGIGEGLATWNTACKEMQPMIEDLREYACGSLYKCALLILYNRPSTTAFSQRGARRRKHSNAWAGTQSCAGKCPLREGVQYRQQCGDAHVHEG